MYHEYRLLSKPIIILMLVASLSACAGPAAEPEKTTETESWEQKEIKGKTEEVPFSTEITDNGNTQETEESETDAQNEEYIFPESADEMISYIHVH